MAEPIVLDCSSNSGAGIGFITLTGSAEFKLFRLDSVGQIQFLGGSPSFIFGKMIYPEKGQIQFTGGFWTDFIVEYEKRNWIAWSDIGNLSFEINHSNIAGERPLLNNGWVYKLLKLDRLVIAYCQNSIEQLTPVDEPFPSWSPKTILNQGLKGKNTVCGDDSAHYFIAADNELYVFENTSNKVLGLSDKGFKKLGFKEFFSVMSSKTVMFIEPETKFIYICDATHGYVLTPFGLGGGFASVTGIQRQDGQTLFASPATLIPAAPEFTTDTIDIKYSGLKTLSEIEISAFTSKDIYACCLYTYGPNQVWTQSAWIKANKHGTVFPNITAQAFRIKIKIDFGITQTYEYVEFDYVKARFKIADKRFELPTLSGKGA